MPATAAGNGGNDVADPARDPQAARLLCAVRRVEDHVLLARANDELKSQRDVFLKQPCATDARVLSGERLRRRPWTRHRGLT